MRSYSEYCSIAKALDLVGDRWSLLIVRELLAVGRRRFSELHDGLPGIATNLLTERLRHLEDGRVVSRDGSGHYALTPWGEHLAEPVYALARWGAPLMSQMASGDTFRSHWLAAPVAFIFGGHDPDRPPLQAEIRADDAAVTLTSADGRVTFTPGPAPVPNLVITGPPDAIIGLLAGRLNETTAAQQGVNILGDFTPLSRLRRADWLTGPEIYAVIGT